MFKLDFDNKKPQESHFPSFTSLPDDIRELLEVYSKIPPNEVIPHIEEVVRAYLTNKEAACVSDHVLTTWSYRDMLLYPNTPIP